MRRNRRKLHRELRERAEARQRARRDARLRKKAERARSRAQAQAALLGRRVRAAGRRAPAPAALPVQNARVAALRELCRLAGLPLPRTQRVLRLFGVLSRCVPELARIDRLPWLLLLATPPWIRSPESWDPPSGSLSRKRDHLAAHLLCTYRVPFFLLRALDVEPLAVARVPVEDEWAVHLLAHVGRGDSLKGVVRSEVLPIPLTRRMVHLLLTASAEHTPVSALRRAQVLGHGGDPRLWRALLYTRLGGLRGPDAAVGEPFWHKAIAWLCRTRGERLSVAELEGVLAWMEARQREMVRRGASLLLTGRSQAAVLREAAAWELRQSRASTFTFPASGLEPLEESAVSITEIRTPTALQQEGEAMAHCCWSYRGLVKKRKVALFSLRRDKERLATIEVALGAGRVVQAKRKRNLPVSQEEASWIQRWAARNRLRVDLGRL